MDSTRAFHITFVCTGNTCRSPMAEVIARRIVAQQGISHVTVGSAGTAAWPGEPASDGAREVTMAAGLDLESHSSTPLTEELVAASGLLLCMGRHHVRHAEELGAAGCAQLLTEMAGESGEVNDPFGQPREVYQAAFDQIERLVQAVLAADGRTRPTAPGP